MTHNPIRYATLIVGGARGNGWAPCYVTVYRKFKSLVTAYRILDLMVWGWSRDEGAKPLWDTAGA